MYSEPSIVYARRAYIKCYIEGVRYRFYNGHQLGINCNPNKCKTAADKNRALSHLCFTLRMKLKEGWIPGQSVQRIKVQLLKKALEDAWESMKNEPLAQKYLDNVEATKDEFIEYLSHRDTTVDGLQASHIKEYLSQYRHSAYAYMNRRSYLSAILSRCLGDRINPVEATPTMKTVPVLHKPFTQQQMHDVLQLLSRVHSNLYLCALIMYGCLLRPHIEIRLLQRRDFSPAMDTISLSGEDNKSRKVRTVMVPVYVQQVLYDRKIDRLSAEMNIFTGTIDHYGEYYFLTAWKRTAKHLIDEEVITPEHTLYSFRHTAAINYYQKVKDPYKLQRLMGHSSLAVTLTYLRNLGLMTNADSESDLPEL